MVEPVTDGRIAAARGCSRFCRHMYPDVHLRTRPRYSSSAAPETLISRKYYILMYLAFLQEESHVCSDANRYRQYSPSDSPGGQCLTIRLLNENPRHFAGRAAGATIRSLQVNRRVASPNLQLPHHRQQSRLAVRTHR